jgi:hypothetical protein
MENPKGFPPSHDTQDSDSFLISYDSNYNFFLLNKGMLLAIAMAAKFAQNCQIYPKYVHRKLA